MGAEYAVSIGHFFAGDTSARLMARERFLHGFQKCMMVIRWRMCALRRKVSYCEIRVVKGKSCK